MNPTTPIFFFSNTSVKSICTMADPWYKKTWYNIAHFVWRHVAVMTANFKLLVLPHSTNDAKFWTRVISIWFQLSTFGDNKINLWLELETNFNLCYNLTLSLINWHLTAFEEEWRHLAGVQSRRKLIHRSSISCLLVPWSDHSINSNT